MGSLPRPFSHLPIPPHPISSHLVNLAKLESRYATDDSRIGWFMDVRIGHPASNLFSLGCYGYLRTHVGIIEAPFCVKVRLVATLQSAMFNILCSDSFAYAAYTYMSRLSHV